MKIKRNKSYLLITYKNYMICIYNNGSIFEGIREGNNLRVSLTEEELKMMDTLFKLFVYCHKKIA